MGVVMTLDTGGLENFCETSVEILQNLSPVLRDVTWMWGSYRVSNHFQKQEDANGRKWPPLSEQTKFQRRNKDKDSIKILQDTGTLMNSLVNGGFRQSAVVDSGANRVEYGTPVQYAAIHEFGGKTPDGHVVPKRSFMPTSESEVREWQELVADAIKERLKKQQ